MTGAGDQASRIAERPGEDTRFIQAVPDVSPGISFAYPFVLPELPCSHIGSGQKLNRSLSRKNLVIHLLIPWGRLQSCRRAPYKRQTSGREGS
ncbi:hypothetical protein ASZ90_015050 [hydrocarbon metagenome]|uniref:Uncharacterized protein n=1 Tax=hydrocarbon metagenome TaxID=938273 RepID=A0A0W8F3A4_9ZZZZ